MTSDESVQIRPGADAHAPVRDVHLNVRSWGAAGDPTILLIGAPTVLSWDPELCRRLAAGGRRVLAYDLRDAGASTRVDPSAPAYDLRDLVADAAELLTALGVERAHVVGMGVAGFIGQVLALDHPDRVATLTLVNTRPVAPGRVDADLPDHDPDLMAELFAGPKPDWSERAAAVAAMVRTGALMAGSGGYDEDAAATRIGEIYDRTAAAAPDADPAVVHPADQMGTTFAAIDAKPRWRRRLPGLAAPTLVVHGADNRFFPVGNGEAIAAAVPHPTLLVLPGVGAELPARVHEPFATALLDHTRA